MKRKVYWLDIYGYHYFETIVDECKFRETLDEVCDKAKAARLSGYAKSEVL